MSAPAPAPPSQTPSSSFPVFAGGLALGLVIGLFLGAVVVPIILARAGVGDGVTSTGPRTWPAKPRPPEFAEPAPEQPTPAPAPTPPPVNPAEPAPAE